MRDKDETVASEQHEIREVPAKLKDFKLLNPEESNQSLLDKLLLIIESQPRPHPILPAIINPINDSDKLIELIRSDPEITAKILQIVNSAAYYRSQSVTSLNYAVMYLGTNLVRDITLRVAIQSDHALTNPVQNFAVEKVWSTGYVASSFGFKLAQLMGLSNAGELSTQSLLLGIGNLAMIGYEADYAQLYTIDIPLIDRIKMEQQDIGANSAMVGGKLAIEWGLPKVLVDCLSNSLIPQVIAPDQCKLDKQTLQNVVFCYAVARIAEMIVYKNIYDVKEIKLDANAALEFHYLNDYLNLAGLDNFHKAFNDPQFHKHASQIIKRIVPSTD